MPKKNEQLEVTLEIPQYGQDGWSDYVVSLFRPDELEKGLPKANGLRRVLNFLFDVVSSTSDQIIMRDNEVSVNWRIEFVPRKELLLDLTKNLPTKVITGFASATTNNVKHPYNKYLAALADTRAEARATRKALLLNCIAAEEVEENVEDPVTNEDITSSQIQVINLIAARNKIDLDKLISYHAKDISTNKVSSLNDLTRSEAGKVANILNQYQSNSGKSIPEELKVK